MFKYSLIRLALWLAAGGILYALGMRNLLWILVFSIFIGWALSYVLFGKQRDAAGLWLEARSQAKQTEPAQTFADLDAEAEEELLKRQTDSEE